MMLAVFSNCGGTVIICEVSNGEPDTSNYFDKGAYDKDDFDMQLVEGPVCVEPSVKHTSERIL